MNAINRYQEVLDTMIVGNRTGIYLSKEELQELLDYVKIVEGWLAADDPTKAATVTYSALQEVRKKLGLTESSPSEPKE